MKQIIQNYRTGKIEVADVPVPYCSSQNILVKILESEKVDDSVIKGVAGHVATSGSMFMEMPWNQKEKILMNVLKRAKKHSHVSPVFLNLIEADRSLSMEKFLLELGSKKGYAYPRELHKEVLRYLMRTNNKEIVDEIIKRYG